MTPFLKTNLMSSVAGILTALYIVSPAFAATPLPTGGNVVGGSASIATSASNVTVTQSSDKAIINWKTFDIGSGDSVNFNQPSSSSVTLNRVVGGRSPSEIYGSLTANGTIMLVNANGIVFGKGAQVNVGALIATSSDISNKNFMDGDYAFNRPGNPNASIINRGDINIKDGGVAELVGPNVTNEGYIQANLGQVALASGDKFTVDLYGDGLINLQASDRLKKQLVENRGIIKANGGQVLMTAAAARNVVDSLINMDGLIEANSARDINGTVFLSGDDVTVTGTIDAKGNRNIDGGTVAISAGDKATIASSAAINASGADGGNVLVAGVDTAIDGSIKAEGHAVGGSGGYVATAGTRSLKVSGTIKAGDKNGTAGVWQAYSSDIVVKDKVSKSRHSQISTASVDSALNSGTNIELIALGNSVDKGNIVIAGDILKTSGNDAGLALGATGNITFVSDVSVASTYNKLSLLAGAVGGQSSILMQGNASINSNGGDVVFYNGAVAISPGASIRSGGGDIALGAGPLGAQGNDSYADGVSIVNATVDAQGGDVTITGVGAADADWGSAGISIRDGSVIKTRGAGSITLTGTGGGNSSTTAAGYDTGVEIFSSSVAVKQGDLTVIGIAGGNNAPTSTANDGISLNAADLAARGDGSITLLGGGGGTSAVTTGDNNGVHIDGGSLVSVKNGALVVDGNGGGNHSAFTSDNNGVLVTGGSRLAATGTGSLIVGGFGGGSDSYESSQNDGVRIADATVSVNQGALLVVGVGGPRLGATTDNVGVDLDNARVEAAHNSPVVLVGVGGGDQSVANGNNGIVVGGRTLIGGRKDDGQIILIADSVKFSRRAAVSTAGNVLFDTYNASTSIGIAGGKGTLQLTKTVLDDVHAGSITVGDTTRDSGKVTADAYDWNTSANILSDSGDIVIEGRQAMGSNAFLADTVQGNIVLGRRGGVSSNAAGDAIVLAASQGDFINRNNNADALTVSNSDGRWLVYSGGPVTDTLGNLVADFHRYSCSFDGSCPVVPSTGNGLLYSVTPTILVTVNDVTVTYGQTPVYTDTVSESYSFKGKTYSLNSDAGDVTLSSIYGVATLNVGSYDIDASAPTGYGYNVSANVGTLTVNPASLFVTADDQFKALGAPNPALTYSYSGLQYADTSGVFTGGLTTAAPDSLPGSYGINQGSLNAGGNYAIVYTPGTLVVESPLEGANAGALDRVIEHRTLSRGRSGTLLSIQNPPSVGNLANLAPAAGGKAPTPTELANLSPSAGGGSITPLIECNEVTPCSLNQ